MQIKSPTLYAIVSHDGLPYMSENCVAQHPDMLQDELQALNEDLVNDGVNPDLHYRIVPLYTEAQRPGEEKIAALFNALDQIEADAYEVDRGGNLTPAEVKALVMSKLVPAIHEIIK